MWSCSYCCITSFPRHYSVLTYAFFRQVSVCCWTLALVEMQLVLPHPAVMTGWACRAWQAGVLGCVALMLVVLRGRWQGKSPLPTSGQAARGPKVA